MTREEAVKKARRITGLARFERTVRGYTIPGSAAAGRYAMLRTVTFNEADRLMGIQNAPSPEYVEKMKPTAEQKRIMASMVEKAKIA